MQFVKTILFLSVLISAVLSQESCPTLGTVYAQWRATGNSMADFSGNNHPLQEPGGNSVNYDTSNQWGTPPDGTYFKFSGNNDMLTVPSFTFPNTFSFCFFLNTRNNQGDRSATRLAYSGNTVFRFRWYGNNDVRFVAKNGKYEYQYTKLMKFNGWAHICLTYDYATETPQFYHDGSLVSSVGTSTDTERSGSGGWIIGGATASSQSESLMDSITLFTRVINSTEVSLLGQNIYLCCGRASNNPAVCSGHGTCSAPDYCVCNPATDWGGPTCFIPKCNNILQGAPGVCNSRGTCVTANTCTCNNPTQYGGNDCQFAYCNGVLANSGSVCNGRGSCTAPEVCACNSCSIGTYCEDEFCTLKTTMSLVGTLTVFTSGTNFNITVDIARTFSTQGQNAIRCGSSTSVFYAVFRITATRYVCTITSASAATLNVGMYIGTTIITSNTVTITAVTPGTVTLYGGNLASLTTSLALQVQLSTALSLSSGVECLSESVAYSATYVAPSQYTCTIASQAPQNPKSVTVSLQYRSGATVISLTNTPVTVYYISAATASFSAGSVNAQIFNQQISVTLEIPANNVHTTLFTTSRVYGTSSSGTSQAASTPSTRSATFTYLCTHDSVMASLMLDISAVGPANIVNISTNALPITCVKNTITASLVERAGLNGTSIPIFVTVPSNALPYYDLVYGQFIVQVGTPTYVATRINVTHFYVSSVAIPASTGMHEVILYYRTLHQNTQIRITSAGPFFASWTRHDLTSVTPYFAKYVNNQPEFYNATIATSRVLTEATGLTCIAQTPSTQIVSVPTVVQSNSVVCNFTFTFTSVTVNVDFYLRLDTGSLDPNRRFIILSQSNVTSAFFAPNMQVQTSFVTFPTATTNYSLSFLTPNANTKQTFSVSARVIGGPYTVTLPCSFPYSATPVCAFSSIVAPSVPSQFSLVISVSAYSLTVPTGLNNVIYWQNTSFVSIRPFLADMRAFVSTPLQLIFTVSYPLNPLFNLFCAMFRGNSNVTVSASFISSTQVSCNFSSANTEETVSFGLYSNYNGNYLVLSNNTESLTFGYYRMFPSVTEKSTNLLHVVQLANSSITAIVPSKYQSLGATSCVFYYSSTSVTLPCSVNSTGHILFNKTSALPGNSIQLYNVQVNFGSSNNYVSLAGPFIQYSTSAIFNVLPRTAFKSSAQAFTIGLTNNTFDASAGSNPYFFCRSSASGMQEFPATTVNNSAITCNIPYVSGSFTLLSVFVRFPIVGLTNYTISDAFPVYYIDKGNMAFVNSTSQTQFFYTGTSLNRVDVTVDISFPSNETKRNIFCRLFQNGVGVYQATNISLSSNLTSQVYTCLAATTIAGRHNLSLWYKDASNIEFEVVNNVLELVFAPQTTITAFSPVVAIVNTSTLVTVSTGFTDVDYGAVSYFCKVSAPNDLGVNASLPATRVLSGVFQCVVYSSFIQNANFTISVVMKGLERTITPNPVNFYFVDSFFLIPNYGLKKGGESFIITKYTDPAIDVSFAITPNANFSCVKDNALVQLNCTSPLNFNNQNLPSYIGYSMYAGIKPLSASFVIYDNKTISSVVPRVLLTTATSTPIVVTLTSMAAFTEGSADGGNVVVSVNEKLVSALRYDLPSSANNTLRLSLPQLPEGVHDIRLLLKHEKMFAIRNSIEISNVVNIVYTDLRIISFSSTNIGRANSPFYVNITLDRYVDPSIYSSIRCVIAGVLLNTQYQQGSLSSIICEINQPAGVYALSVAYANSDVSSPITISSNTLEIVAVQQITISTVLPFISYASSSAITLSTSGSTNPYNAAVYYECISGNNNASVPATRTGASFSCTVARSQVHKADSVRLFVRSTVTTFGMELTVNSFTIYFSEYFTSTQITPFAANFTSAVTTPITLQIDKVPVFALGFSCAYFSVEDGYLTSPAVSTGSTITCNIAKSSMSSSTRIVYVTLLQHDGIVNNNVSTASIEFLYFNSAISFNLTLLDDDSVSQAMAMNFIVQSSASFTYQISYAHAELSTSTLTCDSTTILQNIMCTVPNIISTNTPVLVSFTLSIMNNGRTFVWPISSIVYVHTVSILQVAPFVVSVADRFNTPATFVFYLSKRLNSQFSLRCSFVGATGSALAIVNSNPTLNQATCVMNGFALPDVFNATLRYNSRTFSAASVPITFVNSLQYNGSMDFATGGSSYSLNLTSYPTQDTNYNFQVGFDDRNRIIWASCGIQYPTILCTVPAFPRLTQSLVSSSRVLLYINGQFALTVSRFTIVANPIITSTIPSAVHVNFTNNPLTLVGVFPSFSQFTDIPVTYFANGFQQDVTCYIPPNQNTRLVCPSPQGISDSRVLSVAITVITGLRQTHLNVVQMSNLSLPVITNCSIPSALFVGVSYTITISGANLNYSSASVLFYDAYVQVSIPAIFMNDTQLVVSTPLFYDEIQQYPRILRMKLVYTGGITIPLSDDFTLVYKGLSAISITPLLVPVGEILSSVTLSNVPILTSKPQHNQFRFMLFNEEVQIPLNCSAYNATMVCNVTRAMPSNPSKLDLRMLAYNSSQGVNAFSVVQTALAQTLQVHARPVSNQITPTKIVQSLTGAVRLIGQNFPVSQQIWLRFVLSTRALTYSAPIPGTYESSTSVLFPPFSSVATGSSMQITFNDGATWTDLGAANVAVIPSFSLARIENDEDDDQASLYTFKQVPLTIIGSGFDAQQLSSYRIAFASPVFSAPLVYTNANVTMRFVSSNIITFLSPSLADIKLSHLKFPFALKFGLSTNDGYDYKWLDFFFLDSFRKPLIATSDYTFVEKNKTVDITLRGQYFANLTGCVFVVNETTLYGPIATIDSNTVMCKLLANYTLISENIELNVRNSKDEVSSRAISLVVYDEPKVSSMIPSSAPTSSSVDIVLRVEAVVKKETLAVRVGKVELQKQCKILFAGRTFTRLQCTIEPHEPGLTLVEISYNSKQWYPTNVMFDYKPCPPGFGAQNFKDVCMPCLPGKFKPTSGIYDCFTCKNGTYADSYGSLQCTPCPSAATSKNGAPSFFSCGCIPGYYHNPFFDYRQSSLDYCLPCPSGGVCNQTNTTLPLADFGYWYTKSNISNFFKCNPLAACPGGNFTTCADGYIGDRCGKCAEGYYKFKKACVVCTRDAWVRLVIALILVLVICAIFFSFSSIKVSHINGVAIAFSFWQIISMFAKFPNIQWPEQMSNSITAASLANFNLDFLALECIFPVRFEVRYSLSLFFPLILLILFFLLYLFGELRSFIAYRIAHKIPYKYWPYIEDFEDDEPVYGRIKKLQRFTVNLIRTIIIKIRNGGIWIRNFAVWSLKQGVTREEMRLYRDKIINSYLTFLSFAYSFLMTAASELFTCTRQVEGKLSLDASPDILCWSDSNWYAMLPIGIFLYAGMNGGLIVLYIYLFLARDRMKNKNTPLRQRFKFILQRYRVRFWFWDAVVTLRKTFLSILYIFLKPMLVIVSGLFVVFIGLLLQIGVVPFKRKFHNVMEYFVMMVTLCVLFCGLLFFVNQFPTEGLRQFVQFLAIFVMIAATVAVCLMILWDAHTRSKKDGKRKKREKKRVEAEIQALREQGLPWDHLIKKQKTEFDAEGNVIFKVPFFMEDPESEEDAPSTLNEIFASLFSAKRLYRKLFLVNRKRKRIQKKIEKGAETIRRKTQDIRKSIMVKKVKLSNDK